MLSSILGFNKGAIYTRLNAINTGSVLSFYFKASAKHLGPQRWRCVRLLRWIHCLVSRDEDRQPGIVITTVASFNSSLILLSFSLSLIRLYHVNISVSFAQLDNFHWMIYPELVTRNVAPGGIRMELPWLCQSWRPIETSLSFGIYEFKPQQKLS